MKTEPKISDESVKAKTGKDWNAWFKILERFDVKANGHKAAAKFLTEKHATTAWWSQTITVEYERARGLRDVLQRHDKFFAAAVTRTIKVPAAKAFAAWASGKTMTAWFGRPFKLSFKEGGRYSNDCGDVGKYLKIEQDSFIRFTWDQPLYKPGSIIEITFTPRDENRVAVRLEHLKLQAKKEACMAKEGWTWAMDSLKSFLETGTGIRYDEWKKKQP